MPSDEKTILLLGGSSFLGLQTAETLYYFFDIICTYNQSSMPKFFPEFNWFQIDFLQSEKDLTMNLRRLLEKTGAKYVVNFVGISSPLEAKENKKISQPLNNHTNRLVAQICDKEHVVPIFISS